MNHDALALVLLHSPLPVSGMPPPKPTFILQDPGEACLLRSLPSHTRPILIIVCYCIVYGPLLELFSLGNAIICLDVLPAGCSNILVF